LAGVLSGHLRRVRRRLARALEAHQAGRRPRNRVALRIRDGDHRVVERGTHVRNAGRDVLALAAAYAGSFLAHLVFLICRFVGTRLRAASLACLLLASDCLGRALAGARIRVRALATDRQAATVAEATVAA